MSTNLGTAERPVRIAIIGAGPAGFYAAGALIKQTDVVVSVDIFDRLPAPFGLMRYGVAPDHPKIKNVRKIYERIASDARIRFFGHVNLGSDLTVEDLCAHYDQICYTVGAQSDRSLGIPGEDLAGSMSATEFVAWYNGHPDYVGLNPDLSVTAVAVVGVGNVAMDVARILARSVEELSTTDIADHALEHLRSSQVKDVYVIGRRGPVQAKFTNPEIREFGELSVADAIVAPEDLVLDEHSAAAMEASKSAMKNLEHLRSFAERGAEGKARRVHFMFLQSPTEIHGEKAVEAITLRRNRLELTDGDYLNAVPTDEHVTLPVGMVLRSIGYKGVQLPGVPWESRKGTIPNELGRVKDPESGLVPGQYVAGWAKRGPSGVIGTNKPDAVETVGCMLEDIASGSIGGAEHWQPEAIETLLRERGVRFVSWTDWQKISAAEVSKGEPQGRPRVKFVDVEEILGLTGD